jgi:hypothetical protein
MVRDRDAAAKQTDRLITEHVNAVKTGGRKRMESGSGDGGPSGGNGDHNASIPPVPVKVSKPQRLKIQPA